MARFRISRPARSDIAGILSASETRWGGEARGRYESLIATAMRQAASDPQGEATRDRSDMSPGLRSLHLRRVRVREQQLKVKEPVHVVFFRMAEPDLVEIVRVLHERMELSRHLG